MKESTKTLVEALYKAGYTNIDIFTKDGKISAKDMINQTKDKEVKGNVKRRSKRHYGRTKKKA